MVLGVPAMANSSDTVLMQFRCKSNFYEVADVWESFRAESYLWSRGKADVLVIG